MYDAGHFQNKVKVAINSVIKVKDNDKYDNKDEDGNKGISALRLDIDLVCLRGHLGHNDSYNDNDNNDDKDDDNNNNDISALGLDRDLGVSQGHHGHK